MRPLRLLAVVALLIVAASVVVLTGLFVLLAPECGNQVLSEVPSPNGRLKAVVYQRDCGATTSFSTQVSILGRGEALTGSSSTVFVADLNRGAAPSGPGGGPPVSVRWVSDRELEVTHHPAARVLGAEPRSGSVQVRYRAAVQDGALPVSRSIPNGAAPALAANGNHRAGARPIAERHASTDLAGTGIRGPRDRLEHGTIAFASSRRAPGAPRRHAGPPRRRPRTAGCR